MEGKRFGRLLVLEQAKRSPKSYNRQAVWLCKCDCGSLVEKAGCHLRLGLIISCGCRKKEYTHMTKHGMYKTRFYACWADMRDRCKIKSRTRKWYYDRGITVCPEWESFEQFKEDMYLSYSDNLTLDRINPNKGYCKENCRWATKQEQADNRTTTRWLTFNGESHTIAQWARKQKIPVTTVYNRIRVRKLSPEEALCLL